MRRLGEEQGSCGYSLMKMLVCALYVEQNEKWTTVRRYMRMEPLYEEENRILKVDPEKEVVEAT